MKAAIRRFTVTVAVAAIALQAPSPARGGAFHPRNGYGRTIPGIDSYIAGNNHFFAADSGAVLIYNTSGVVVNRIYVPGVVSDVDFFNNILYLAANNLGLLAYDVTNPASPVFADAWKPIDGVVRGVTIANGYGYLIVRTVSSGDQIRTLHLGTKSVTGTFTPAGTDHEIYGFGGTIEATSTSVAYISRNPGAAFDIDFSILDTRTAPQNPTYAGKVAVPGRVQSLKADPASSLLHIAEATGFNGIRIYDLADPLAPLHKGSASGIAAGANAIDVNGGFAHVAVGGTGQIAIYNVSTGVPSFVSALASGGVPLLTSAVTSNIMLSAGGNAVSVDEARRFNVASKAAPFFLDSKDIPDYVEGIYVVGNYAYLADGYDGLWIVDVSNPDSPIEVGTVDSGESVGNPNGNLSENIWVSDDGRYAYSCEGNWTAVYDTINKSAPATVFTQNYGGWQEGIRAKGSFLYVFAHNPAQCTLASLANPASPSSPFTLQIPVACTPKDGFVDDNDYVYIAAAERLVILRRVGSTLQFISSFHVQGMSGYAQTEIWDVEKSGNHLFCAAKRPGTSSSTVGMLVFNVSNPASPQFVTTLATPDNGFEGVWVENNICYLSTDALTGGGGISAVDISNPASPVLIDRLPLGETVLNTHVRNGRVYCAGFRGGAPIGDFKQPLFSDDFSGTLSNWTTVGGTWGILSGEMSGANVSGGGMCVANPSTGANEVQSLFRAINVPGTLGFGTVMFDYVDAANTKFAAAYALGDEIWLGEVIAGAAYIRQIVPQTIEFGVNYTLKVEFFGRMAEVYLDGVKKAAYNYSSDANGKAGVSVFYSQCNFDNFVAH